MTKTSSASTRVDGVVMPFGQASSLADVLFAAAPAMFIAMPQIAPAGPVDQWQAAFASVADGTMQAIAATTADAATAANKRYAVTTNHAVRGDKGSKPWGFPS